jgi:hypothetical protein
MDSAIFDELQRTLNTDGPRAAIDRLCTELRASKNYNELFYALLLKKRHELGVSPLPTGASADLPASVHAEYEDAIRQAGRLVGNLFLEEGDIPQAWTFFRMLGEPEPVAKALDKYQPGEDDDFQPLLEIAFHQGVHPKKGFDLILERHGICSAITSVGGDLPLPQEVREYCYKRLVRALHEQLRDRLRMEIERQEGTAPPQSATVPELIAGRPWLFEDDLYHVDISHLSAVVQMSAQLSPCPELNLARELCAYGEKLSPRLQMEGDPPFDNQYHDLGIYLSILAGDRVDEGLAHFRAKVESADPAEVGTFPAEVLVNLLLKINRPAQALEVAQKYLATANERQLSCPGIAELCQRVRDYRPLVAVARERQDPVNFMAGLLAASADNQKR